MNIETGKIIGGGTTSSTTMEAQLKLLRDYQTREYRTLNSGEILELGRKLLKRAMNPNKR